MRSVLPFKYEMHDIKTDQEMSQLLTTDQPMAPCERYTGTVTNSRVH